MSLNSAVLVLNRSYFPIHVTSAKRALSLLYQGWARAVAANYETFDFSSWSDLAVENRGDSVGLVQRVIRIPRVILLVTYDRFPRRDVRFSRYNIYARDRNRCQYCGRKFPRSELNLDHIIPRSLGGKTTWENVVCSCTECNRRKGGRTPDQAGLRLTTPPHKPSWTPLMHPSLRGAQYAEWLPFLSVVDVSYWYLELQEA